MKHLRICSKTFSLIVTIFLILAASSIYAETYTFKDTQPYDQNNLNNAFSPNFIFGSEFKATIDRSAKTLDLKVTFKNAYLRPNGFQFVITGGAMPSKTGSQATIYFDASTAGSPKLTAYGYNALAMFNYDCGEKPGSWQFGAAPNLPADRIKAYNSSNWVISTTDVDNGTTRTLGAKINLVDLQNHIPLYPDSDPWIGLDFKDDLGNVGKIGVWLWASALSSAPTYDAQGYLTSWPITQNNNNIKQCIAYDFGDTDTNKQPECSGANSSLTINYDTPANFTITATDKENDKLLVSYSGIPSGASVTPNAGMYMPPVDVDFNWTPKVTDAGKTYNFIATFSDNINPALQCPVSIIVPANLEPNCQISGALENQACAGDQTIIDLDALKSFDPEGASLDYAWSLSCNGAASLTSLNTVNTSLVFTAPASGIDTECVVSLEVSDGNKSSSCKATASVNGCPVCTDQAVSSTIGLLDSNTFTMSKLVLNSASEIKRITGEKVSSAIKSLVKQAKAAHNSAWAAINAVPTTITSCLNANACVNISHADSISTFKDSSTELLQLINTITGEIKSALAANPSVKNRSRWKRFRKKGLALDQENQIQASALPSVNTVCP